MSLVTETYTRKPFEITAVRVTPENIEEVAKWCGGVLDTTPSGKQYIKVDVTRPLNEKQTRAFAGDWVLVVKNSFKVYTDKAFKHCFDKGTIKSNYRPDSQPTLFDTPHDEFMEDTRPLKGNLEVRPKPAIHTLPKGYPEPSTR